MTSVKSYRNLIGKTQAEMAAIFGISRQAYYQKEHGKISFKHDEMMVFKDLVAIEIPNVTIDSIFFAKNTKKNKEKEVEQ